MKLNLAGLHRQNVGHATELVKIIAQPTSTLQMSKPVHPLNQQSHVISIVLDETFELGVSWFLV